MRLQKDTPLKVLFFSSFFFFGLFKEYAACLYTGLWGLYLFVFTGKKKEWKFYLNQESLSVLIITAFYFLSCLYGIDKGMSLIGAMRMLGVAFFMVLAMQLSEEGRNRLLTLVPWIGVCMTIIGILSKPFAPIRDFFYVADRLGGFFQYPNVYALFCLTGILIVAKEREEKHVPKTWLTIFQVVVLMSGILLSGSRTVFFLLVGAAVVAAVRRNEMRIPVLIGLAAVLALSMAYVAVSGNYQNVGRFLTASFSSSTLIGRIIYARDGLSLLLSHPFGLGYLGYYYLEPEIQTAFYSVRFIHNDFLQLAMDVGVLPCILFTVMYLKNIFSKRHSFWERLILGVIGVHFLVDFDLEFISVWYLLIILLQVNYGKEIQISVEKQKDAGFTAVRICAAALALIGIYFGCAMIPRYVGNPGLSSRLLPLYTESNVETLVRADDADAAEALAKKIQKQNRYIAEVYDVLSVTAYQRGDYEEMISDKKKSLSLQKYNMEAYERYVRRLAQAIEVESQANRADTTVYLLEAVAEVPVILENVEKGTDELAYRTRDIPDFTLDEDIQEYIESVRQLLEE